MEIDGSPERLDALKIAEAQYAATSTIYGSNDPVEILSALADFTATPFVSTHLALIEDERQPNQLTVIASGDKNGLRPTRSLSKLDEYPAYETLSAVEVLNIADVDTDPFLVDAERARLKANAVQAMLIVPLAIGQRLTGLVVFTYDKQTNYSQARLRAVRNLADQIAVVFENQSLLRQAQNNARELEQQVRTLQMINQFSMGLGVYRDEQQLLDYAAQSMTAALNVDHVGIALLDRGGEFGTVVSEYPDHGAVGSRLDIGNNPLTMALIENPDRSAIIQEVEDSELITDTTREVLRRIGVVRIMVVPLRLQGELAGTVGFDIYDPQQSFAHNAIEVAQTMVAQLMISLQNVRLLTDAQRRAEQLQHVASFGQSVQASLDMDNILGSMLAETRRTIPVDRLTISLFDPLTEQLRIVAQYEDGSTSIDLANGTPIALTGTFAGQVWETQELLAIADTQAAGGAGRAHDVAMRSLMIAPIRSRGRLLGTVSASANRPYAYEDTDVAIFQQMVNQLAVAIENSETFAQSQRTAKNEALVNAISAQFQSYSNVQDMMNAAITELGNAIGARRARVRLSTDLKEG